MMKRILAMLLAVLMLVSIVACGGSDKPADDKAADAADDAVKVCVVYSGNLGDKSYNDSCNMGSTKAQEDFGIELKTLEGTTADEWKANLLSACEDGYEGQCRGYRNRTFGTFGMPRFQRAGWSPLWLVGV